MNPALRRAALLGAFCLCAAAAAVPPAPPRLVQKQGRASAWVTSPGKDPLALWLSEKPVVTLRVEAPAPLTVEVTEKPKATPQWTLEEKGPPTSRKEGKAAAVWEQEFVLTPLAAGAHAVELPPLRYRSGKGDWQPVEWKPLTVQVRKAELGSARDILPPEEVPESAAGGGWLVWAGVGAAALLLGVTALVVRRRRGAKPPPLPPHEWALRELDKLAAGAPATAAEVEAYHTALSQVVRRYLERRFRLPAERRTTPEFVEAVRATSDLTAEQQKALGELLARCDLAKFARVQPSPEECQAVLAEARKFVEATALAAQAV